MLGDFNNNGVLDSEDIELLSEVIRNGTNDPTFDIHANSPGVVDNRELRVWIQDLKQTWFGDTDLNGLFDSSDLRNSIPVR